MSDKAQQPEKKEGEASTSANGAGEKVETKKKLPQLGALEDDDEFEDFPANAEQSTNVLQALNKSGPSADHLWEDNWDDDDIEDDFTKQLRTAIAERNGTGGDEAMEK